MIKCTILPFVALLVSFAMLNARAQLSPEDSLAQMTVADGLEVTLFAAEPDLRNPTAMDIDAEGRVWITEAVNYRLFNQPVADDAGDRIRVLEDTDGDGRCDKAWTFYQDPTLQAPLGIAVLGDRVYVCQSPDLFYLRDTNGDGKADEKTVVLTGFGGVDHDHAIHGVMFGPDGWLYLSNGDRGLDVTDKSGNRVHAGENAPFPAATVLRADLDGNHIELLASNMRNPYEPAVNSFGTVFISDNDDDGNEQTRINYVMEGGNYGYWPRRKGDRKLDAVHWNEDRPGTIPKMLKTGFGSPTGMVFYDGARLLDKHRFTIIHADAGPGEIRSYRPIPDGAGYRAEMEVLLASKDDRWFRPSDVCVAPDGSVFVADWYDPGVGGHRMGDVEDGRIYRLARTGETYKPNRVDLESRAGIVGTMASPNLAERFLGYRLLEKQALGGDVTTLSYLSQVGNDVMRGRVLWLLAKSPKSGLAAVLDASRAQNPELRVQSVRVLAEMNALGEAEWLLDDPNPSVRRQVLVELRKHNSEPWAREWIVRLALQYDGQDRFYREAIGIASHGIEEQVLAEVWKASLEVWNPKTAGLALQLHPSRTLDLAVAALGNKKLDISLRAAALDAIDAVGGDRAGELLVAQLALDADPALTRCALVLLSRDEGDAWRAAVRGSNVDDYLRAALNDPARKDAAWNFVSETRRAQFVPLLMDLARRQDAALTDRVRALETVQRLASRESSTSAQTSVTDLTALLDDASPEISAAAIEALSAYRGDQPLQALRNFAQDAQRPHALRVDAARRLARSQPGSLALLDAARRGELHADLTLDVTELMNSSRFDDIRAMATQVLPREQSREGAALPALDELHAKRGDAERGRRVFFSEERSQCYSCHAIDGQGKVVGPDLSKIGAKLSRESLYESILNPSAAIAHEYMVWMLRTEKDGYLSGYIRSEDEQLLELMDSSGNPVRVRKEDVIERWQSDLSLMPTGLSAGMTVDELVDLVEFLGTLK